MTAAEKYARNRRMIRKELRTGPGHARIEAQAGPEAARREQLTHSPSWNIHRAKKRFLAIAILISLAPASRAQSSLAPNQPSAISSPTGHGHWRGMLLAPASETKRTLIDMATWRDKPFAAVGWTYIAGYGTDMLSTRGINSRCAQCAESGPFFKGTRAIGKMSLAWGGVLLINLVVSHAIKKHVHNPWLRAVWPAGPAWQTEQHIHASIVNEGLR